MKNYQAQFCKIVIILVSVFSLSSTVSASQKKDSFKVAWSIYSGWMPWGYATDNGIIDKWAKKYDIKIEVVKLNDYIESIIQYTAGEFDACGMTNMDALTIPSVSGVDTTGLILGDYSNGNDAVLLKEGKTFTDIKGQHVNLVELSVSHYLLARGLDTYGMSERDIRVVNTSDADIVSSYATPDVTAAAVWNPQLSMILDQYPDATAVFTSAEIPGEIIDMMAVNTEVLKANPDFAKALVGAWFETMQLMSANTDAAKAARTSMAQNSGTDLAGYDAQLKLTEMFYTPAAALAFTTNKTLYNTMDKIRKFSFDKGLFGADASTPDIVGIELTDGKVLGDTSNIKLRFNSKFVEMAKNGEL
ncbi:putative urea ABC transporter substrate-binding protein [Paraglaciecola sp. L3A3]|uniref:putative urea ABC transporter substrate-binding protein n=1 Tax=Paraglaciecola sp. L3A3 TaxID=2686358 RepID=UPI00131D335C|nr:putative urea ABC transporter substrate-binding protein [Paraglaciecola sp. L3A3]